MKKKVVMLLAALMLASSVTAYAGPWDKIRQVIDILLGDGGIPCWSSGNHPANCTSTYVSCATCIEVTGTPTGGKGTCNP